MKTKIDRRQLATYTVIVLFMAVTVGHVANYAGSFEPGAWAILGWVYALAVDGSILVCAWLTRWATTRRWAWVGYVLGVLASGALNVAQVEPWSVGVGAWVYAVFPTIAQGLLGFLARDAGQFVKRRDTDERLSKARTELRDARAECAQLETALAQRRTLRHPSRADYDEICAGLNGDAPKNARAVNNLLNDHDCYSVPDSTARTWAMPG